MTKCIATQMGPFKLMTNINDKNYSKKQKKIQLKLKKHISIRGVPKS